MNSTGEPTEQEKTAGDAAAVRFFPPGLPLLTVVAGFLLERVFPIGSDLMLQGSLRYVLGGALIVAPFFFLGFLAVHAFQKAGQSVNPYKNTSEIVETGPFRFTRNPMYLQMVLICIGFAILLANVWIAILTPVCAILLQVLVIRPEEIYLERKFGDAYRDYKRRVRRWI